jgi:hypothetical protein
MLFRLFLGATVRAVISVLQVCLYKNGDFKMEEFTDEFEKIMVFGDYEGDLKAIVDNLNSLQCGISEQWAVKQSRVPGGGARREVIAPKGDYNATLRCALSELSALISPHLNKGTIEFVAVRAHGGTFGTSDFSLDQMAPRNIISVLRISVTVRAIRRRCITSPNHQKAHAAESIRDRESLAAVRASLLIELSLDKT